MNEITDTLASRLIRNFNDVALEHQVREPLYQSLAARLATGTVAQKLGASIDTVAPGKRSCPYHFHYAQEEMFVVLEGSGPLRVAEQALKYLSIRTRESPEICEYPDSGKYQTMAASGDAKNFGAIQRASESIDYWDGEP